MSDQPDVDWDKTAGLVPAAVQDALTGQLLMLGYMNSEALQKTLATGQVTFYSRSRQTLWTKGETSGNRLCLVDIRTDCDNDTLLVTARRSGPVCHTGTVTCFDGASDQAGFGFLGVLEALVSQRLAQGPKGSYTASLAASGIRRIAQKVGEEGVEVALAAAAGSDDELIAECADLLFHTLVLLRKRGLTLSSVVQELANRHKPANAPAAPD